MEFDSAALILLNDVGWSGTCFSQLSRLVLNWVREGSLLSCTSCHKFEGMALYRLQHVSSTECFLIHMGVLLSV